MGPAIPKGDPVVQASVFIATSLDGFIARANDDLDPGHRLRQ
jgi:hypothetical protein